MNIQIIDKDGAWFDLDQAKTFVAGPDTYYETRIGGWVRFDGKGYALSSEAEAFKALVKSVSKDISNKLWDVVEEQVSKDVHDPSKEV